MNAQSESKPRLLDLFCCEGGASMGYHRAGFDVVGVDIDSRTRYPFAFHRLDATRLLFVDQGPPVDHRYMTVNVSRFAAIHASPPCQAHSKAQRIQDNEHPDLIAKMRERLDGSGLPYVIENVPGAPLLDPVELCGTMFGLPLYRHRLFECGGGFSFDVPLHGQHWLKQVKMGRKPGPNEIIQPVGNFSGVDEGREAMGMPWATRDGLREAIPPAYTEYIGEHLIAHLSWGESPLGGVEVGYDAG